MAFLKLNCLAFVSLRSKRFRAVSEQTARNESQRPREKWDEYKSGQHPLFGSRSIFRAAEPMFLVVPRSFFTPGSETARKRLLRMLGFCQPALQT